MSSSFQPHRKKRHNWHLCFRSSWSSSTLAGAGCRCSVDVRTFDGTAKVSEAQLGKKPSAKPSWCAKKDPKKNAYTCSILFNIVQLSIPRHLSWVKLKGWTTYPAIKLSIYQSVILSPLILFYSIHPPISIHLGWTAPTSWSTITAAPCPWTDTLLAHHHPAAERTARLWIERDPLKRRQMRHPRVQRLPGICWINGLM